MNTSIDTQKIEKLNQLKEQQKQLELEIKNQQNITQNEIKKAEAVEYAKNMIKAYTERENNLRAVQNAAITMATNMGHQFTVNTYQREIFETPYAYIRDEHGRDIKWTGDPVKGNAETTVIKYSDVELKFDASGKIELPYNIAKSFRIYTLKGAIKKIDEYRQKEQSKENLKEREAKAVRAATSWLTNSIKQSGAEATITTNVTGAMNPTYGRCQTSEWREWTEITIQFANGNKLRYKVSSSLDKPFIINLMEFIDTRITDIKKDPILSINHLK